MVRREDYELEDENPKLKKQREKQIDQAAREVEDLRKVLQTKEGRRLLYWIIHTSGVHKRSATSSGSDTYFNEGLRFMGTMIYQRIWDNFPETYLLMSNEAKDEDNAS